MPRTVEHIVDCHQAAASLRAAGKPIWKRTIDIKAIIHEDQDNETPEHIRDVANRIARLLRATIPASFLDDRSDDCYYDLLEVVEQMEECTIAALAEDKNNGVEAVEILNDWLEVIYDWADYNRVWLGN